MYISWRKSGVSFFKYISIFSETFILLLTTRSTIVALPSTLRGLRELNFNKCLIDSYMPLGSSLLRMGTMSFFAIVTLFIMGIFNVPITLDKILFITVSCTFAGIATVGTTGIITLQMISVVLNPLGLPLGGVMAILIAIDAVVDVFDTFANMVGNMAILALADKEKKW
jgi:proton glutamate symport protein